MSETAAPASPDAPRFLFAYRVVVLDSALRWGALALESRDFIAPWLYWVAQFIIIPLVVIPVVSYRRDTVATREKVEPRHIRIEFDAASITFLVVVWAIGAYFSFVLPSLRYAWLEFIAGILMSLLFAGYLAGLADLSVGHRIAPDAELQVFEPQDDNDRRIAHLETNRAVLFQRVDTYTLEGTFLGAISFSAFVTILSDHADATVAPLVTALENFLLDVARARAVEATTAQEALGAVRATEPLLAAIAGETLMCSACFLSVLIARIRFMYAIRDADYCIRLASMMNAKEEDMVNLSLTTTADQRPAIEERLTSIRRNIDEAIRLADRALGTLRPLILYMSVFRTLGLLFFLLTIVTGALWFSRVMALVFAALCLVAYLYPFLDRFRDRASRVLPAQLERLHWRR